LAIENKAFAQALLERLGLYRALPTTDWHDSLPPTRDRPRWPRSARCRCSCVPDRHRSQSHWAAKFAGRQRLILFPADVGDIAVLFFAILEEDRTVEVLIVIVVRLG
jgi:hypothetical protein